MNINMNTYEHSKTLNDVFDILYVFCFGKKKDVGGML